LIVVFFYWEQVTGDFFFVQKPLFSVVKEADLDTLEVLTAKYHDPITLPVSTGSVNLDVLLGDIRSVSLTGNLTISLTNTLGFTGTIRLIVSHHTSNTYNVVFNSVHSIGATGSTNKSFSCGGGSNKYTLFDIFCRGNYVNFVAQGRFYA